MYIYYSPAFDSRMHQETLSEEEYVTWLSKFLSEDYQPNFLSPFSANQSILELTSIPPESVMSDS
jgi:hypothetical protein